MKAFMCLVFLLTPTTASFSQVSEPVLTTDVIFNRTALKELRFPSEAFRQEKSVRVYVRFTVTQEGEYEDVSIANSEPIDESFQKELDRFWPKLPKQDPLYAGLYVIPINFLYGERGTG
jgi:TonB family protein